MFDELAFRLYGALPKDENAFFSPLSIGAALSALALGARGQTAKELCQLLGLPRDDPSYAPRVAGLLEGLSRRRGQAWEEDERTGEGRVVERDIFTLRIANALFVQSGYSIEIAYREALASQMETDMVELDFARRSEAASQVNRWIERETHGKIGHLVSADAIHDLTRLILANAVYFLAEWRYPFEPDATRPAPFFLLPNSTRETVQVPMMRTTEYFACTVDARLALRAVELPYDAMSMLVILPEPGRFSRVEARLDAELVARVVGRLEDRRISLEFPRFTLETEYGLTGPLSRLGVRAAFDPRSADFTGITAHPEGLAVDNVLHMARIRVDEHGTEAAAATAEIMDGLSEEPEEPLPFIVNRPFIFCIRDPETEAILFVGRVTDPIGGKR
jgi:serpin B